MPTKCTTLRVLDSSMFSRIAFKRRQVSGWFCEKHFYSISAYFCYGSTISSFFLSSCCRLHTSEYIFMPLRFLKSWIIMKKILESMRSIESMFRVRSEAVFRYFEQSSL
jgi:hypothetical protein